MPASLVRAGPVDGRRRLVDIVVASLLAGAAVIAWRLWLGNPPASLPMYVGIVPIALCLGLVLGLGAAVNVDALVYPAAAVAVLLLVLFADRLIGNRILRVALMAALLSLFSAWIVHNSGQMGF